MLWKRPLKFHFRKLDLFRCSHLPYRLALNTRNLEVSTECHMFAWRKASDAKNIGTLLLDLMIKGWIWIGPCPCLCSQTFILSSLPSFSGWLYLSDAAPTSPSFRIKHWTFSTKHQTSNIIINCSCPSGSGQIHFVLPNSYIIATTISSPYPLALGTTLWMYVRTWSFTPK